MIARYLIATGVSVVFALVLLVIGFMVIVGVSMRPSIEADNNLNHPNDLFARAMTFAHLAACPTDIRNGKIRYIYTGLQQSFDGSFDASPTEVDEWIRQSTSMQSGRTTTLPNGSTEYQLACPEFVAGSVSLSADHAHVSFEVHTHT